jgi:AraC-like DNA-binding protein
MLSLQKFNFSMLRIVLLLSPIYVTLFWSIALTGNEKKNSAPQLFLSKFMLLPAVCFAALFLYFAPFHSIYPYFNCVLQYAASLALPVYYIYFRLLTIDNKFSIKAHARYLAVPFILATTFSVGAFLTPVNEFTTWLFDKNAFPDSPYIQFLSIIRNLLRILFLIQLVATLIGNQLLIKKYGLKAEQFYSDMEDENYKNARMLNYCIMSISVVSFIALALYHELLITKDTMLYIICSFSSVMLYFLGYIGLKQKPINPAFESGNNNDIQSQLEIIPVGSRKKILDKMLILFEEDKIYLNSQLNIMDIVHAVGTNRTYISSIINQQYNQNFCSFVNRYRLEELEKVLFENPDFTNEVLAECCGFGSLNSLKRAVLTKTGLSIPEWKRQILVNKKIG